MTASSSAAGAGQGRRRSRRRAVRPCDTADYDRRADVPGGLFSVGQGEAGADAWRAVELDEFPLSEEGHLYQGADRDEAFYREQMPPHYGS